MEQHSQPSAVQASRVTLLFWSEHRGRKYNLPSSHACMEAQHKPWDPGHISRPPWCLVLHVFMIAFGLSENTIIAPSSAPISYRVAASCSDLASRSQKRAGDCVGESRVESQEGGSFYSGTETGGTQMGLKDGKGWWGCLSPLCNSLFLAKSLCSLPLESF